MKDEKMISARVTPELHRQFKTACAAQGISAQDILAEIVAGWLAGNERVRELERQRDDLADALRELKEAVQQVLEMESSAEYPTETLESLDSQLGHEYEQARGLLERLDVLQSEEGQDD